MPTKGVNRVCGLRAVICTVKNISIQVSFFTKQKKKTSADVAC